MAGDPSAIPDGHVYSLRNVLPRPGPRYDSRPPFVYDNLMNVTGLALWEDLSKVTRFIAFDSSGNFYIKSATAETWSGATATSLPAGSRLVSWTSYRGKFYAMFDDGAGTPAATLTYDGTNISLAPFNSPILAKCVAPYGDRIFLANNRIVVKNLFGTTKAYVATGGNWTLGNVDAEDIALGSATVGRLIPTATTGAFATAKAENVVALATTAHRVYRCDLQSESAVYDMPLTLQVKLKATWDVGIAVSIHGLVTPSAANGFRYKANNAGVTGGAEPVWPTTLRATVVDNGITWICEGLDTLGSLQTVLPNSTDSPSFISNYIPAELPPTPDDYDVYGRIVFGNDAIPTITLAAINFSYRDAKADSDPAKANFGQQFTSGDFYPPFFNNETTDTRTVNLDSVIWSETSEPARIRAANSYQPKEIAGFSEALFVLGGRLVMGKRRAIWTFKLTDDPNNPILPETPPRVGIGIIGSLAFDVFMDELFFISEEECYRMRVGGDPAPICGDGMREEVMSKGANWVELQTTPANQPLVTIDRKNRDVWFKTQKGKLYCYHLGFGDAAPAWSTHDTGTEDVTAMLYNPTTSKVYVSFNGKGLTRLDDTLTQKDVIDNTAAQTSVIKEITPRPFELFNASRFELALHELGLFHLATASQASNDLFGYVSFDRGKTFTKYIDLRLDLTTPRIPFPLFQSGVSVMPKFTHVGEAGAAAFSASRADALIELLSGEWPFTQPAQLGGGL